MKIEGVRSGFVDYGGCFCRGGKEARKDENAGKGGWGRGVWKSRRKGGIGIRDEAVKPSIPLTMPKHQ